MKFVLFLLMAGLVTVTACQQDDVPTPPQRTTKEKLLGQWKLEKEQIDDYDPIPVLINSQVYMGDPEDSIVFKSDNMLYTYIDDVVPEISPYVVINDTTLAIDGDTMKIRELTDTRLHIFAEEIDYNLNDRTVFNAWFKR